MSSRHNAPQGTNHNMENNSMGNDGMRNFGKENQPRGNIGNAPPLALSQQAEVPFYAYANPMGDSARYKNLDVGSQHRSIARNPFKNPNSWGQQKAAQNQQPAVAADPRLQFAGNKHGRIGLRTQYFGYPPGANFQGTAMGNQMNPTFFHTCQRGNGSSSVIINNPIFHSCNQIGQATYRELLMGDDVSPNEAVYPSNVGNWNDRNSTAPDMVSNPGTAHQLASTAYSRQQIRAILQEQSPYQQGQPSQQKQFPEGPRNNTQVEQSHPRQQQDNVPSQRQAKPQKAPPSGSTPAPFKGFEYYAPTQGTGKGQWKDDPSEAQIPGFIPAPPPTRLPNRPSLSNQGYANGLLIPQNAPQTLNPRTSTQARAVNSAQQIPSNQATGFGPAGIPRSRQLMLASRPMQEQSANSHQRQGKAVYPPGYTQPQRPVSVQRTIQLPGIVTAQPNSAPQAQNNAVKFEFHDLVPSESSGKKRHPQTQGHGMSKRGLDEHRMIPQVQTPLYLTNESQNHSLIQRKRSLSIPGSASSLQRTLWVKSNTQSPTFSPETQNSMINSTPSATPNPPQESPSSSNSAVTYPFPDTRVNGLYQCPAPDCVFIHKQRHQMQQHLLTHRHIKAYRCILPDCTQAFATKAPLTKHIRENHREVVCAVCHEILGRQCWLKPEAGWGGELMQQVKDKVEMHKGCLNKRKANRDWKCECRCGVKKRCLGDLREHVLIEHVHHGEDCSAWILTEGHQGVDDVGQDVGQEASQVQGSAYIVPEEPGLGGVAQNAGEDAEDVHDSGYTVSGDSKD